MLLAAVGSAGDVHPMTALALALRDRGHDPVLIAAPKFEQLARKLGLDYVPIGSEEDFIRTTNDPDFRRRGMRSIARKVRPLYEIILRKQIPGKTILIGSVNSFGARLARETHGIPLASIHLQPAVLRSEYDAPGLPLPEFPGLPKRLARLVRRAQFAVSDRWLRARIFEPPLNSFRAELGLRAVRSPFSHWVHSPDLNIGLFPRWFARPEPDWPPHTELTDFPLFDEGGVAAANPALAEFLDSGDPPIVFSHGSENRFAEKFFQVAVEVCRSMGSRGVLLTQFANQVPADLPPEMRHFPYIPLSRLLPYSRAFVHHGGIGNSAQALAAGAPHVVVPYANDQPDNGARLKRLGVASVISPRAYRPERVIRTLDRLLASEQVARNCRLWASRLAESDPLPRACRLIEQLTTAA